MKSRFILIIGLFLALPLVARADMSPAEQEQFRKMQRDVEILQRQMDQVLRSQRSATPSSRAVESMPSTIKPMISLGTNQVMGSKDAKIAFIEFSDYQCPYCTRFHRETFNRLKRKFFDTGQVAYAFRDQPSPERPQALRAAVAARCAGEQERYFDMQTVLFNNTTRLKDDIYSKYAKELGLDVSKFDACMINEQVLSRVDKDIVAGRHLGIRGTPTFFVGKLEGGRVVGPVRLIGALPYTTFRKTIENLLKEAGN